MKSSAQYQREYRERRALQGLAEFDHQHAMEYQKIYRQKAKELEIATLQKSPEQKALHAQHQRIYVKRKLAEGIDVYKDQNEKRKKEGDIFDNIPRLDFPTPEEQAGLDRITQAHLHKQAQAKQAEALEQQSFQQSLSQPSIPLDLEEDVKNRDDSKCDF